MCLKILVLLLGILLAGNRDIEPQEMTYEREIEQVEAGCEHEEEKESVFGSVSYFRDDTGRDAQLADGYLYGYWNGKLCRYDVNNDYAEQLLFDKGCNQAGSFCISDGVIYFLTRPVTSTVTNENTCLYKINCDGSDLTLLQDKIPDVIYIWKNYAIEIYDNTIFLKTEDNTSEVLCYGIKSDGEVERVAVSETVYGKIPEGFKEAEGSGFPSLTYMLRNYGYVFLEKEEDQSIYAYDFESNTMERLDFGEIQVDNSNLFVTHNAIYFGECNRKSFSMQWYCLPLDNLQEPRKWIQYDELNYNDRVFLGEDAVYFVKWDSEFERWEIYTADYEKETVTLVSKSGKKEKAGDTYPVFHYKNNLWYFDGEAFYYNETGKWTDEAYAGDDCIIRYNLDGNRQVICAYAKNTDAEEKLCYFETEEYSYEIPPGAGIGEEDVFVEMYGSGDLRFYVTRTFLRGTAPEIQKINAYMQEVYKECDETWEQCKSMWNDMVLNHDMSEEIPDAYVLLDLTGTELEVGSGISYVDERYIVFRVMEGGYWSGAAHPNYSYTHYVFDRSTGERLSIGDLVNKSDREICDIIAPYIDKDYNFNEGIWNIEPELVLDPDRLFLTKEGIGIFFNRYDIDCYAAGEIEFVIPYEAFK